MRRSSRILTAVLAAAVLSCNGNGGGEDADTQTDLTDPDLTGDETADPQAEDLAPAEDLPDAADLEPEAEIPPPPGLEKNGRWLSYHGLPLFLVGVDAQSTACNPDLDYNEFLDLLVSHDLTKIRVWIYCSFGTSGGLLIPWAREPDGRFNLDEWNDEYWTRLRDFVEAAHDRDIIVEASIFHSNFINRADTWSSDQFRLVWNSDFNVNGVFSTNAAGHFYPEFYDLDHAEVSDTGHSLQDYQQAIVDKTLDEIGEYENVYFEVSNEFLFPNTQADVDAHHGWQQHWASYIRDRAPERLVGVMAHAGSGAHTRGIEYWWNESYIDIMNFHLYEYDPNVIGSVLHEAQTHDKVLVTNESGDVLDGDGNLQTALLDNSTRYAWGMLTAGGYFTQYLEDRFLADRQWVPALERMQVMRRIAGNTDWWLMSPVDDGGNEYDFLVSQGPSADWQVLACPGVSYLVYFWGTPVDREALIDLPPDSYAFEWFDCEDGESLDFGTSGGGDAASITAPAASDWNGDVGLAIVINAE
jgi:hypothetical protein